MQQITSFLHHLKFSPISNNIETLPSPVSPVTYPPCSDKTSLHAPFLLQDPLAQPALHHPNQQSSHSLHIALKFPYTQASISLLRPQFPFNNNSSHSGRDQPVRQEVQHSFIGTNCMEQVSVRRRARGLWCRIGCMGLRGVMDMW